MPPWGVLKPLPQKSRVLCLLALLTRPNVTTIALAPITIPVGTNTSVHGRMAKGTDKAPLPLPMETNTSVNTRMAKSTDKAPGPMVLRVSGQETNTSVNSRIANPTDKAPGS